MENPCTLPSQLVIESDLGGQLLNAAVLQDERWRGMSTRGRQDASRIKAHARRVEDTIALGVSAMLEHCRHLLRAAPLEIVNGHDGSTILRVCQALDYVIDEANCRIYGRAAHHGAHLLINQAGMAQRADTALAYENIDLLLPLCKPFWLSFVAYLPDGICGTSTDTDVFQLPLWQHLPNAAQVLDAICQAAQHRLHADPEFQRLRGALSYRLMEIIGTPTVHLAMHARTQVKGWGLDARDVCQVWKYRHLYHRMDRENPHLLPVLSAWLQQRRLPDDHGLEDAIPSMRQDLLAHGLPPRAWRYLVEHGPRPLTYRTHDVLTWSGLVDVLKQLHKARWPAPPPRGFLGLLHDTAGLPESYHCAGDGVPGWFWDWCCREARACQGDAQRYRQLQDDLVQWAWLVREHGPRPDSNQQRRRLRWLKSWADHQESITVKSSRDAWGLWLREMPWETIERLRVVPLLSPGALREESLAMHNCADRYLPDCVDGNYLLLSLRQPDSEKRVALMGLKRQHIQAPWMLAELAEPCNRPPPAWLHTIADAVLAMVRQGSDAQHAAQGLLHAVAARFNPNHPRHDDATRRD